MVKVFEPKHVLQAEHIEFFQQNGRVLAPEHVLLKVTPRRVVNLRDRSRLLLTYVLR